MSKKIAIYPGTFDPITKGHIDIISRASQLFDVVVIGVAESLRKNPMFDIKKRLQWCRDSLNHLSNIQVEVMPGLSVDFATAHHARYLLRGIRTVDDVDYELSIAGMNRALSKNTLETVFLPSQGEYRFVSATMVREIMSLKGDASAFVPEAVLRDL